MGALIASSVKVKYECMSGSLNPLFKNIYVIGEIFSSLLGLIKVYSMVIAPYKIIRSLNNLRNFKSIIIIVFLMMSGVYELHVSLNKKHSIEYEKENDERMQFLELKAKSKVANITFDFSLILTVVCMITLALTHNVLVGGILIGISVIPIMMIVLEIIFLAYYDK